MNDNEYNIGMVMSGTQGFPTIYGKGMLDELPFIILQQLGLTINDLIRRNKQHFCTKTVVSIGIALLDLIERMHDKGYIHCDVKPDNIMIGDYKNELNEMNQLYLIDFGISMPYQDEQGNHNQLEVDVPFKGNAIFSSKNAFARITLSRRDDIISLVYLLVYLVDTELTWIDFDKPIIQQFEDIANYKINTSAKDFLSKRTKYLLPLLEYAYKLGFDERPDYTRMKFMFRKILMEKDYKPIVGYEWSLRQGENFEKINPNNRFSDISSCDINSNEEVYDDDAVNDLRSNINKQIFEYNKIKKPNFQLMKSAICGSGEKYFRIPNSFFKFGELQYLPIEALEPGRRNQILL